MIKFATVTIVNNNGFYIKFNGEQEASQRIYKKLATYVPKVGDRVAVIKDGNNYVILGTID